MAASLVTRAKNELVSLRDRAKRADIRRKEESAEVTRSVSVLAGAALAALVDEKFASEGEDTATVGKIPTNALIGLGAVGAAAMVKTLPYRREIASAGLGMASIAVYQLVRDNVEFEPK